MVLGMEEMGVQKGRKGNYRNENDSVCSGNIIFVWNTLTGMNSKILKSDQKVENEF